MSYFEDFHDQMIKVCFLVLCLSLAGLCSCFQSWSGVHRWKQLISKKPLLLTPVATPLLSQDDVDDDCEEGLWTDRCKYFQKVFDHAPVQRMFPDAKLIEGVDYQVDIKDGKTVKGFGLEPKDRIVGVPCILPSVLPTSGNVNDQVQHHISEPNELLWCPPTVRISHDFDLRIRKNTDVAGTFHTLPHYSLYPVNDVSCVEEWSDIVFNQCKWKEPVETHNNADTHMNSMISSFFGGNAIQNGCQKLPREELPPRYSSHLLFLSKRLVEDFEKFSDHHKLLANDILSWIALDQPKHTTAWYGTHRAENAWVLFNSIWHTYTKRREITETIDFMSDLISDLEHLADYCCELERQGKKPFYRNTPDLPDFNLAR